MNDQEVAETLARYNEAWNAHDLDTILAMHAPDSVFETHCTGEVSVGRAAIAEKLTGYYKSFPDLNWSYRRQYVRDDLAVQEWTCTGTQYDTTYRSGLYVQPTGREVEYLGVDIIVWVDGLIARKDVYSDGVTMLRQLGVTDIAVSA